MFVEKRDTSVRTISRNSDLTRQILSKTPRKTRTLIAISRKLPSHNDVNNNQEKYDVEQNHLLPVLPRETSTVTCNTLFLLSRFDSRASPRHDPQNRPP